MQRAAPDKQTDDAAARRLASARSPPVLASDTSEPQVLSRGQVPADVASAAATAEAAYVAAVAVMQQGSDGAPASGASAAASPAVRRTSSTSDVLQAAGAAGTPSEPAPPLRRASSTTSIASARRAQHKMEQNVQIATLFPAVKQSFVATDQRWEDVDLDALRAEYKQRLASQYRQNMTSILNDPRASSGGEWSLAGIWDSGKTAPDPHAVAVPSISVFRSYLAEIEPVYASLQRHLDSLDDRSAMIDQEQRNSSRSSSAGLGGGTGAVVPARDERDAIPAEFFAEDFDVSGNEMFLRAVEDRAASKMVLSRLRHVLDVAERRISVQIAAKSDAFFAALTNIQNLHAEVIRAGSDIRDLRKRMADVNAQLVRGGMRVLQLRRRRERQASIQHKLQLMDNVRQAQPTVQQLLATSDFAGALDLIATTQDVLRNELAGVTAFKHLSVQLDELVKLIDRMMGSEFVDMAVGKLEPTAAVPADEYQSDVVDAPLPDFAGTASLPAAMIPQAVEVQVRPLLLGFVRMRKLQPVLDSYREKLVLDVKTVVRTVIAEAAPPPESAQPPPPQQLQQQSEQPMVSVAADAPAPTPPSRDPSPLLTKAFRKVTKRSTPSAIDPNAPAAAVAAAASPGSVSNSAGNTPTAAGSAAAAPVDPVAEAETMLRSLSTAAFLALFHRICLSVMVCVRRAHAFHQLVASVVQMEAERDPALQSESMLQASQDVLVSTTELMHRQIGQYLGMRSSGNSLRLAPRRFQQLHRMLASFIDASDALVGVQAHGLRGSMGTFARGFLVSFHRTKMTKLAMLLDNETWRPAAAVPYDLQHAADALTAAADTATPMAPPTGRTDDTPKHLYVHGTPHPVANHVLLLLPLLREYLKLAESMPSLSPDLVQRLVELLKMYNSRSCQLVLGAGAMHVAGLKSISAKHLGVASECIAVLHALLPSLRARFQAVLPPQHAFLLDELDRVQTDLADHRREIFNKLVSIMRERADFHCRALAKVSFHDAKLPTPTPYIAALMKECGTLNRVLAALLPERDVGAIFDQVWAGFADLLAPAWGKLDLNSTTAQRRARDDLAYLKAQWNQLRHVHPPGTQLDRVFGGPRMSTSS